METGDTIYISLLNNIIYGGNCSPNDKNIFGSSKGILLSTELSLNVFGYDSLYKRTSFLRGIKLKKGFLHAYISSEVRILPCRMVLTEKNIMSASKLRA